MIFKWGFIAYFQKEMMKKIKEVIIPDFCKNFNQQLPTGDDYFVGNKVSSIYTKSKLELNKS